jgi:two-component system sensor histidine kinase AtoS
VKILSGDTRKQHGRIVLNGTEIDYLTPRRAIQEKIATVYEHLTVIPSLNAVENVFAGRLRSFWFPFHIGSKNFGIAKGIFDRLGVHFDFTAPASSLSREEQHMIEVARAFSLEPRIVILDEVAKRLNPGQVEQVFSLLEEYRAEGTAVIYVTTDMEEVLKKADRVTVLRGGYRRATERVSELDLFNLLKLTHGFALDVDGEPAQSRASLAQRYNEDMINQLSVGVIILDEQSSVYTINPAAKEILDVTGVPVCGNPIQELLEPTRCDCIEDVLSAVRDGRRESWPEVQFGDKRVVNIKSFPLRDEERAVQGSILLFEDVSMDRSVKDYLARAEKAASIAELAAGVAHEINNPLGIIQNYIELLKLGSLAESEQERIAKIEKELGRIVNIVGSLLSFSRVRQVPNKNVNLTEALDEVVLLLSHKLKEKRIDLRKEIAEERVFVAGDENRLKQVMMNLLMNSIEAVLDYGTIRVGVSVDHDRGYCELNVTDNGHGIPPEVQNEIFTPFYSTKTYKKNTGLGLAICQHLVESHGGVLTFESKPAEATTFTVRLPVAAADQSAASGFTGAGYESEGAGPASRGARSRGHRVSEPLAGSRRSAGRQQRHDSAQEP